MQLNIGPLNELQVDGTLENSSMVLLTIGKSVAQREAYEGQLLSIGKSIATSVAASTLIFIGKDIQVVQPNTFYTRNGWDLFITLGTQLITPSIIHGGVQVIKNEDDNHTAEFTIIMRPNTYNLYDYQGKSVKIQAKVAGVTRTVFTGNVDIPTIDVINEKLTLRCVADRRKLLGNLTAYEPYIGYYSATVLGTNESTYDRINARLQTIPSSLDFDGSNNYALTSWTPKSTADYTYGSSAVYRRDPQLILESSAKIVNKISIDIAYSYQRNHHRSAFYYWKHPYGPDNPTLGTGSICPFLADRPSMPTREMIRTAATSTGWQIEPYTLYFGKQFASNSYTCNGAWVMWSTVESINQNIAVKNSDGTAATDAKGNEIYRSVPVVVSDNTDLYTMESQWISSTRFKQNIQESYTISVVAPSSLSVYGNLEQTQSYSYNGVDSYADWETYVAGQPAPYGVTTYTDNLSGSYFFNSNVDRPTFNNALVSALHKAQTAILSSHRDTRIIFQRFISPELELKHTIALSGKWVRGKGKCQRIVHSFCVSDCSFGTAGEAYTEVQLAQYRSTATVTDTPLSVPTPPADTYVLPQTGATLDTHLGEDPSTPQAASWNGYVGNIYLLEFLPGIGNNHTRSKYQEMFIVDAPVIPDQIRSNREIGSEVTYNVNIPSDSTVYESYG